MSENQNLVSLGERLRAVRKAKKLSLPSVEKMSNGEFKAVVIGSYERGARAMTVEKLIALADFYQVPVQTFLQGSDNKQGEIRIPKILDLQKIATRSKQGDRHNLLNYQILARYLSRITHERQDWNGEVISLRESDYRNIAICQNQNIDELFSWITFEELALSLQN